MKKASFLGIILCIISYLLIALSISIDSVKFIIHMGLLLFELYTIVKHKDIEYLMSTFLLGLVSISLLQYTDILNNHLVILYFIGFVLTMIYGYKYIFKNEYNKMDLEFKRLEVPKTEAFLACKYISGLPYKYLGNAIITKDEKNIYIKIESPKIDQIYEMAISENQLVKIESYARPYVLTQNLKDEGIREKKKRKPLIKKKKNTFDKPDVKVIPSFNLQIKLKNGTTIDLITFNNPASFFK